MVAAQETPISLLIRRGAARHYEAADATLQYGWDGKQAWQIAKDRNSFAYNTRFWALTPYFFAAQPFVLYGQGINLELLPQKTFKGKEQQVIKVTFDANTGDAPDDYYVLYFDKETHLLSVIRYIVSYPDYFKDGGHSPEKLMVLKNQQPVNGIVFPETYKTYWLTESEEAGEYITDIILSAIAFQPKTEKEIFNTPIYAEVVEGL